MKSKLLTLPFFMFVMHGFTAPITVTPTIPFLKTLTTVNALVASPLVANPKVTIAKAVTNTTATSNATALDNALAVTTATTTTAISAVLSGLLYSTIYNAKVSTNCGSDGISDRSSVESFTTLPALGTYPDVTVNTAGGNSSAIPTGTAASFSTAIAYTTTNFKGVLAVGATGTVFITNAHPAGTYVITVDAGVDGTENFTLTVGDTACSQGNFIASPMASLENYSAVGDFNNDGFQDIASQTATNQFTVLLGNAVGGFGSPINTTTQRPSISNVAVGDFNGDGKQDIATTHYTSGKGAIFFGNGAGGFTNGQQSINVGAGPQSLSVGDFNEDGKQDIAVANQNFTNGGSVSILIGDGLGAFTVSTPLIVGLNSKEVVIGDFNGDSHQDLATTNPGNNTVSINLGVGDGTFGAKTDITVGANPTGIAIGDFNNDTHQDFAASNSDDGTISIVLGQGDGSFTVGTTVTVGADSWDVTIGDFNGDGDQDIASANRDSDSISIRLGDGTGNFTGATEVAVGNNPQSVAVGDFNQDGLQDIAAPNFILFGVLEDNSITLVSAADTNAQTSCINTTITAVTYNTTGATGATFTGLQDGLTGSWATDEVTISGTPSVAGIFNYTVTMTGGCTGGTNTATGSITIEENSITLASAADTNAQTSLVNTAITNITYNTAGATDATFTGLPAGVTGSWATDEVTISGTPSVAGIFNYTVTMTGGCTGGTNTAAGSITIEADNSITLTSAADTNAQTSCINTIITAVTYNTTGATGAIFTGLPDGLTGSWIADEVIISGTPSVAGIFNYTVTMTGGCTGGTNTATGSITIEADNSITLTSAADTNAQTSLVNTAITNITYNTAGATDATFTGLPAGVIGSWIADEVTISGTPSVAGIFNYTVTMMGGCTGGTNTATGSITIEENSITLAFFQVGIGTTIPEASSLLDVESTTKGFLPPRLTSVQRNAIANPAEGLTIYNTENKCLETFTGTGWISISDGSALTVTNACDPTSPTVVVDVVAAGETWMDRNLGASQAATGSTDFLAYGNLYQWGRGSDGHECINWTSSTGSDGDEQTNESTGTSSSTSPGSTFITGTVSNNWYSGSDPNNLWQGETGINNPCPSGYRLPIETELQALDNSFAPNNAGGAATSPVKMPVAGFRSYSSGALLNVGSNGSYWSSKVSGPFAVVLSFNSGGSLVGNSIRAYGGSVRCLKD